MSVLLLLFLAASGVSVTDPKPLMPPNATIEGNAMCWKSQYLAIRIEPLTSAEFFDWLRGHEVSDDLLNHARVSDVLHRFAVFRISFYNLGEERMVVNPDQFLLRNAYGVVGSQVKASDFLAAEQGHHDRRLEAMAALFHQDTFELAPQQKIGRLVAFRSLDDRFPRKIRLVINRLYYGVDAIDFGCEYRIRYVSL